MKKVIAVFDIGKTNKKLLLFDENLNMVFQHEQKFAEILDDEAFECDDIDLISSWIKTELVNLSTREEFKVVAVNFSTYGASLMFLDEKGNRLTPVYNYLKKVDPLLSEELFSKYGGVEEFCRITASPNLGLLLNSGIQMLWMQNEKPEVMEKVASILHFPQYLSYNLSGEVVSEPTSIGCHTFLWNFDENKYHEWVKDYGINLPEPINNDVVFDAQLGEAGLKVGTGIHDSSASLVPYLKGSKEEFVLVSTGTWCINMNPFNTEPLTTSQLKSDCLCFLSPEQRQVKSSRLFMGHFHEVWVDILADHFKVPFDTFRDLKFDGDKVEVVRSTFEGFPVYFPNGKDSFDVGLESLNLDVFENYEEAYTKLMIDLTVLCVDSIRLVIPKDDSTKNIFISGGFARNEIFVRLIARHFPAKKVFTSEIDNASAMGAALVVYNEFGNPDQPNLDLGLVEWSS